MNYSEFIPAAKRTESTIEKVHVNKHLFNGLTIAILRLSDNLDLIKKNVFYGKSIDKERFRKNINRAMHELQENLTVSAVNLPSDDVSINPRVFHAAIGMATESAELLELINLNDEYPNRLKVADELGDYSWYNAIMCDELALDMEAEVLTGVIEKLKTRFPDKFEAALAITKDKETELLATGSKVS